MSVGEQDVYIACTIPGVLAVPTWAMFYFIGVCLVSICACPGLSQQAQVMFEFSFNKLMVCYMLHQSLQHDRQTAKMIQSADSGEASRPHSSMKLKRTCWTVSNA